MTKEGTDLIALAKQLEACAEDAKRDEPVLGYPGVSRRQPPAIISLANGLLAIAKGLRAIASHKEKSRG